MNGEESASVQEWVLISGKRGLELKREGRRKSGHTFCRRTLPNGEWGNDSSFWNDTVLHYHTAVFDLTLFPLQKRILEDERRVFVSKSKKLFFWIFFYEYRSCTNIHVVSNGYGRYHTVLFDQNEASYFERKESDSFWERDKGRMNNWILSHYTTLPQLYFGKICSYHTLFPYHTLFFP